MMNLHSERRGTVLIVDDESTNIEVLAAVLEPDYDILFATSGPESLEVAVSSRPDLILLDVMMPGMDGFEVCQHLKEGRDTADIPVIFITACGDVAAESRGLKAGALDYITKPINPLVVQVRVRNQIQLKFAHNELIRLAITDGLTGLPNRRHFDSSLHLEYRRLCRSERPLSLVLFDIDHFKLFNDSYGHVAGDDCLRRVGAVVRKALSRAADTSARYGGEEFACILPETDHDGAFAIAERLRTSISDLGIPHTRSPVADHVTASFGVVTAHCVDGRSPLHLVAQVDEQLYAAKSGGRNRISATVVRPPQSPDTNLD